MNFQLSEKCVVSEEWKDGIGHDFRHYKGKMYRLLGLALHSETLEPMKDWTVYRIAGETLTKLAGGRS